MKGKQMALNLFQKEQEWPLLMMVNIMDNGITEKCMAREFLFGKMGKNMMANMLQEKNKAEDILCLKVVNHMMDNGKMVKCMGME